MLTKTLYRSDMLRCVLCHDAPCTSACGRLDPAGLLRSIWFDNEKQAAARLLVEIPCRDCAAPCEKACVRPQEVPIRRLILRLQEEVKPELEVDPPADEERLRTEICGVPLENPFLLSSSVVGSTYDMCARAFEAGWAGVSFKTICSLDIHEASPRFSAITSDTGTIIGFKNIEQLSDHSVAENMEIFRELKKKYPSKVILASIMGQNEAEWEELSRLCAENGADAIELNFSCPNMAEGGLGSDIGQIPELVERFTASARKGTDIPVLAKLTPNVANMSPAAEAALRGGADGISAINTIKSITGVGLHTYVPEPAVHGMSAVGGYSGNAVKPIGLRFIQELGKSGSMKDVVPEDQAGAIVSDELLADDEGLGQAVRRRLLGVLETDAIVRTVPEQAAEARQVLRCRNNQNLPDAGLEQDGHRIIDHRLVIDGQKLLGNPFGDGVKTGSGSSGKYDSFHKLRLIKQR